MASSPVKTFSLLSSTFVNNQQLSPHGVWFILPLPIFFDKLKQIFKSFAWNYYMYFHPKLLTRWCLTRYPVVKPIAFCICLFQNPPKRVVFPAPPTSRLSFNWFGPVQISWVGRSTSGGAALRGTPGQMTCTPPHFYVVWSKVKFLVENLTSVKITTANLRFSPVPLDQDDDTD